MTNRNPKKTPKFAMSPSMQRFRNFKDLWLLFSPNGGVCIDGNSDNSDCWLEWH
jgi:hypothetical protein